MTIERDSEAVIDAMDLKGFFSKERETVEFKRGRPRPSSSFPQGEGGGG